MTFIIACDVTKEGLRFAETVKEEREIGRGAFRKQWAAET
jgi:hypothetical protein